MTPEANERLIDVFPITSTAFGFRADWIEVYADRLVHPAYLVMTLALVIGVGIMALRRFEHVDLVKKLWNLPVILVVLLFWPSLIMALKEIVDVFNTFLIIEVFQFSWSGFGFPNLESISNVIGWSTEALARFLPNVSYWIVYTFYIINVFFLSILGPFLLAKGILFDEIDMFLELVGELLILFLWQTTLIILVAFVMPEIVSGKPFPPESNANFYFLSFLLGIMILFVPSITRKFGNHFGSSIFPPTFKWAGTLVGLTAITRSISGSLASVGMPISGRGIGIWRHRAITLREFHKQHQSDLEVLKLEDRNKMLAEQVQRSQAEIHDGILSAEPEQQERRNIVLFLQKAKSETQRAR